MIKVLLVDDQQSVRQGLRMRLQVEPDMSVVGEADDGAQALDLAEQLHPDVVVMDLEMPHVDGFTATRTLHTSDPARPVVILSLYDDEATRARALEAGAAAFVAKCAAEGTLLAAIREAAGGPRLHSA